MLKPCFFLLIGLVFTHAIYSQKSASGQELLLAKMEQFAKAHPSEILYLHIDKTIYTNNETVWFAAYLLKSSAVNLKEHSILAVTLVREDNHKIFLQNKYVMDEGLSSGSISLPDTIPPGNYQLIATTNVMKTEGAPIALFRQPITIKSITDRSFSASLALIDTIVTNDVVRVKVNITYPHINPKEKKQLNLEYNVTKREGRSVTLKNQNEYIITISASNLNQPNPVLSALLNYEGETQYLTIKLPVLKSKEISVRFFPEGGNLISGLTSRIGWEAKTSHNQPIALNGILLKDNIPVDTISTNNNGIGVFSFVPDSKNLYSVKVLANPYLKKDTIYLLPQALKDGIVLHLPKSVINDTLSVVLTSNQIRNVQVIVHNYSDDFMTAVPASLKASENKITLVLPDIPKGINTVTVLDEMGRPLAERIFFARYNQRIMAEINSNKNTYGKKEKATIKLKLNDKKGEPIRGIISVAVVQDNRIEASKFQDIESYFYLDHELGSLSNDPSIGKGYNNPNFLEEALLVRGWRRYTWQNMMASSIDSLRLFSLPIISAQVSYRGKPLKKPVTVGVIRDSLIDIISTENKGTLPLTLENLLVGEGRKVFLLVNETDKEDYAIDIEDPFKKINQKLSDDIQSVEKGYVRAIQNSEEWQLKGLEKTVTLQTVVVSTKKDNSIYGAKMNACGDYVCSYNILNCPNHYNWVGNKAPVAGEQYNLSNGGVTVYKGCVGIEEKRTLMIKGVYTAREFYGLDISSSGMQQTQYLSTLYWKPVLEINNNGETEFSFFTGDITGKFRVIIQGISEDDVISAEHFFSVN